MIRPLLLLSLLLFALLLLLAPPPPPCPPSPPNLLPPRRPPAPPALQDNELIIVLEWAESGDLGQILKGRAAASAALPLPEVWALFSQVCSAVRHMHGTPHHPFAHTQTPRSCAQSDA
jgi:hypothetical protein